MAHSLGKGHVLRIVEELLEGAHGEGGVAGNLGRQRRRFRYEPISRDDAIHESPLEHLVGGVLVAIPRTQWEAGTAIGLTYLEQLRHVIIPQAVRIAIPPTVGFLVQLIKNTSLAAVIGFVELTREGQMTTAATFQPFAVYLLVAALYFSLCYPLTRYSRILEGRRRAVR